MDGPFASGHANLLCTDPILEYVRPEGKMYMDRPFARGHANLLCTVPILVYVHPGDKDKCK